MKDVIGAALIDQSIRHLKSDFMVKISSCVEQLEQDQIWWRPNENSNSIGNQILHLSGNLRQWIVAGVGRTTDTRKRDSEFSSQGGLTKNELLNDLTRTVDEAEAVLKDLTSDQLLEEREIQVYRVTVLQAVLHVVEHFSYHTGQIIYITKLMLDRDLDFYPDLKGNQTPTGRYPR